MFSIGIINLDSGNLASLINAFKILEVKAKIIENYKDIKKFNKILLPGVGHFKNACESLKKKKFNKELINFTQKEKNKILGICLGMQLLFENSEEGNINGLNLIKGKVKKFDKTKKDIKIPHIGWNSVKIKNQSYLFKDISDMTDFYFVHSYMVKQNLKNEIIGETDNSDIFTSAINKKNIYGVQFHPEKSHKAGLKILRNFVEL